MKPAAWMGLACALATVLAALGGASGQTGKDGKDKQSDKSEVNIVLRVTRKIVSDITTKKVDRSTPIRGNDMTSDERIDRLEKVLARAEERIAILEY